MAEKTVGRASFTYAFACAVAVVTAAHSIETTAAPCSTADEQVRTHYYDAAQNALKAGNLTQYRNLQQVLPGKLSPACRKILDQLEPMRVKCSAEEKSIVLQRYQAVMQAAWSGDLMGIFSQMNELEQSLSEQCWLAINRQTDPRVQGACTGAELDHVASFAGPLLRATSRALSTGDFGPVLQITQAVFAPLTQDCQYAFARLQQEAQKSPQKSAKQYQPTNVIDHGGGTYSMPGVGACTPSGCMAF